MSKSMPYRLASAASLFGLWMLASEVPAAPVQLTPTLPPMEPTSPAPFVAEPAPRPDPFRQALTAGVAAGVGAFGAFAAYGWLARRLRNYAAYLKTRRLHRRVDRERRAGRRL